MGIEISFKCSFSSFAVKDAERLNGTTSGEGGSTTIFVEVRREAIRSDGLGILDGSIDILFFFVTRSNWVCFANEIG